MANTHDAEDVTAAAFFELWRKRRTVRTVQGSVLLRLLVTTVNLSRNAHRSSTRYQKALRAMPRTDAVTEADAELVETRNRLARSLQQLSPTDSTLFVLTAPEELPLAGSASSRSREAS